jgi:hypothetical protein
MQASVMIALLMVALCLGILKLWQIPGVIVAVIYCVKVIRNARLEKQK